jgi:hypothetical protein
MAGAGSMSATAMRFSEIGLQAISSRRVSVFLRLG